MDQRARAQTVVLQGARLLLLLGLILVVAAGCARVAAEIDEYSPSEPIEVEIGDAVSLSVTFTNTGNRARDFIARATVVDGQGAVVRRHETVLEDSLQPGQRATVSWEHAVRREGEFLLQFSLWRDADTMLHQQPAESQRLIVVREAEPDTDPDGPPSVAEFAIGDRVQVAGAPLRVRVAPGTSEPDVSSEYYPGSMPVGSLGTVVDGPEEADGYVWWRIDYDRGVVGWSAQDWLERRSGNG